MRVVAVMLVALALAAALAEAAAPLRGASGLRGTVMRGPTKPVCDEARPCVEPAVGVVLEFKRAGVVIARAKTGAAGAYSVKLRPGRYAVSSPQHRVGAGLTPRTVTVPLGRFGRVDFHLDTGIQ